MNKTLKYTLLGLCGTLIVSCIIFCAIFGRTERGGVVCKRIEVNITDSTDIHFTTSKEIKTYLEKEYGRCVGMLLDSIDLREIERLVDNKSAVLKSQVYTTKDSTLHIEISQRKPIARFQNGQKGFYADSDGYIFPLQSSYASHVQIIDGDIPVNVADGHKGEVENPDEKEWLLDMIELIKFIENNKEWKRLVVQIHVRKKDELILIPREGDEKFTFGYPDDIEEKFDKIKKYYTAIVAKKGTGYYKSVDLRFKGQIICK